MSALPQDEDLSALINDLDDLDGAIDFVPKPKPKPKSIPIIEEHQIEETAAESEPIIHEPDQTPPTSGGNLVDLNNIYSDSLQELINNYRKDRNDVDKLIAYLWDKLNKSDTSRIFLETLAVSLRTKSEANTNLIKLIDLVGRKIDKSSGVDGLDLGDLLND